MATTLILLTVHLLHLTSTLTAATNRRILHQPFFPLDSTPPSPPPTTTSPSSPFFPSYPSPPPPLTSPASPFASFPANISSLILPHSPSSHPLPHKLISITFAVSLSAAVSAAVALFFFFRGRRRRGSAASDDKAAVNTTATTMTSNSIYRPPPSNAPPTPPPQLRKPSSNSSEFLYLGTLVNSTDVNGGGGEGGAKRRVIDPRKLNSPELQPLPPLYGRDNCQNDIEEDEREEFYSPRGWASGRESGSGGSRRIFEAVVRAQAEQLMSNNGGGNIGGVNSNDSTSCSSSSSSSGSPARSASISISPPVSNSPKNRSNPKSSPEFIEMQVNHLQQDPPVPDMSYSPSYSLSSIPSSPERGMKTIKEDDGEEAEESPLLSNASSSSRINSPPLSPLKGKIGNLSPEERDWGVLGQNSPSLPNGSTPKRSISSPIATITSFLRGGKRKDSNSMNSSISVSDSLVSSHSHPSPISSTGSSSRISRSYPCSPLSGANSQRLSSVSCGNSPRLSNVSDQKVSSPVRDTSCVAPQPPPPPPPPPTLPPPALRRSQSPPLPPAPTVSEPDVAVTPPKLVAVKKRALETPVEGSGSTDEDTAPKPKLKPLHWDKVRASSDREMVWDQLRSSSFKLNEEMIETLFVVNTPNSNQKETPQTYAQPYPNQENRLLDPKKAQNIAILLRALNVTMEEVCEALLEGNAETLGTELLESLLKMAPTKEEERKLKEYKDDSPVRLGHAEKFLKAVIDIPFAFRRVEAMLYMTNFESEVEYLKKSFASLEAACDELRSSRMFLKLLEAVLKTGNRMNIGTNRGDAQAFKLDTLLKLVDVKGTDGKTTLLHFVVQEISRTEGQRLCVSNNQSLNEEAKCRKLGLQVVSSLTADLANVKKSAAMDSDVLNNDVSKLTSGLANIAEVVRLNEQTTLQKTNTIFSESLNKFVKIAEEEIIRVQAQESVTLSLVKEITEYFHGNSAKEEAHPFRIFMVVRDFLTILDRVCKEVGMINERTFVSSAHRFPIPVNPMLPVPVNPLLPRVLPDFPSRRQSSFDDDGSP